MTQLTEYQKNPYEAVVADSHRLTPKNTVEVRSIRLTVPRPNFSYTEGQNIGVIVPGPHEYGRDTHFRLYTIANSPGTAENGDVEIELCVRRCFYIDEISGEEHPGIASNYLCDASPGDRVSITGPYGDAFRIPEDPASNLLMIGSGTGIAPFRAFIQHIYAKQPDWKGQLRLYYGARSGAETLYRNDQKNDLDQYYDQKTFQAFEGLSHRPWIDHEDSGLTSVLDKNAHEIWDLMQDPLTHVFIAGLARTLEELETAIIRVAGSRARWHWTREEMIEQGRWSELLYDRNS
ncbi:MAG: FAD-binding oxidoreductase [Gammaproteobacteria bacterium]